jgi:hypothetical protein
MCHQEQKIPSPDLWSDERIFFDLFYQMSWLSPVDDPAQGT